MSEYVKPTPKVVDRYWEGFAYKRPDLRHDRWSFDNGFEFGARWIFETTGAMTGAVRQQWLERLPDLVEVIRWLKDEDEHERAIAWAESNLNAEELDIRRANGSDELEDLPF